MKKLIFLLAGALSLSACAWVELTPDGKKVRVLEKTEVSSCKHLGNTTVTVKSELAGIDRLEKKVQEELEILARNAATGMQGDTVIPVTEIKKGTQTFSVYRCVNP